MDNESEITFGEYLRENFVPDREPESTGSEYFDAAFNLSWDWMKAIRGIVQMIAISISYLGMRMRIRRESSRLPEKPGTMPDPRDTKPPVVVPIMPM